VLARRARPAWLLDVHRWLGALATIFVGIHVLAILFDTYMQFSIVALFVPFASAWNPSAMAWGIVGFWVLLAVELTSLALTLLRLWQLDERETAPTRRPAALRR